MSVSNYEDLCLSVFSKEGLLGRSLEGFEERKEQQQMAIKALQAYDQEQIALIEAGTGTGKSLAYLFPALYWALKHQVKTVISTYTIALQEQLFSKDIPFLLKTLDTDVKVSLVKGMGNYVCLRKLDEHLRQLLLISSQEMGEMQKVEEYIERKDKGSFSEFPFAVSASAKEKIAAESDSCNHVNCPHYKECFFFKERKEALNSQILIVNHHLLLADLQRRLKDPGSDSILPEHERLILDEAHHFEQVALSSLAQKWRRLDLMRYLAKIHSETHPEKSRLALLKKALSSHVEIPFPLLERLEVDLPAQKRSCQVALDEFFSTAQAFFSSLLDANEGRLRLLKSVTEEELWQEVVDTGLKSADECVKCSQMLIGLFSQLEAFKEEGFFSSLSTHTAELSAISQRLDEAAVFLRYFLQEEVKQEAVRWAEWSTSNLTLVEAALDLSSCLHEHIFSKLRTSVLCSATLAVGTSFEPIKKRLGLTAQSQRVQESVWQSPFDYQNRTLFAVPSDFPLPASKEFFSACVDILEDLIYASEGSALFLFTSYEMLKACHFKLSSRIGKEYPLLRQGEKPRAALLNEFRSEEKSVLLATDSFWEGIDVPGEALRCVVIVKLPFLVPDDPLHEAYAESLQKAGQDPFMDFSVPQAVIKFKQGFGRLMRHHQDQGCVICLDQRLIKKGYGRQFLQSLPPCQTFFGGQMELIKEVKEFYKKTGA